MILTLSPLTPGRPAAPRSPGIPCIPGDPTPPGAPAAPGSPCTQKKVYINICMSPKARPSVYTSAFALGKKRTWLQYPCSICVNDIKFQRLKCFMHLIG